MSSLSDRQTEKTNRLTSGPKLKSVVMKEMPLVLSANSSDGNNKGYVVNDVDRAKSLSRLLDNMLLGSGKMLANATSSGKSQLQLTLPPQYSEAIVEHYVNHLNGNKKNILNCKFLVRAFELADFMEDDVYFEWLIKQLFDGWNILSADFYEATIESLVVDRIMLRVPYNFLSPAYKQNRNFIIEWVESNRGKVVTLNFTERYYLNVSDSNGTKVMSVARLPGEFLINYVEVNGQRQESTSIGYCYDKDAIDHFPIYTVKLVCHQSQSAN